MIPSTSARKVKKPAAGIPAARKPNPARKDCTTATPTTPRDTLRMVPAASSAISSAWSLRVRRKNALSESANCGPGEYRNAATTIDATNSKRPNTKLWAISSSWPPSGLSLGATSIRIAFVSVATRVHRSYTCSPISGQPFTVSAGNGMDKSFESSFPTTSSTSSINFNPSQATGPTTIIRHNNVITVAASRRLRSRRVSQSNNGYSPTVSTTLHSATVRKGPITFNDQYTSRPRRPILIATSTVTDVAELVFATG